MDAEDLAVRLSPLRVRGEGWYSCALRVPTTVALLFLCAALRSLTDVVVCASDAHMCVSANGVVLEPLPPGAGAEALLRLIAARNSSLGGLAEERGGLSTASSYVSRRWLQPGVVGEDAAVPAPESCSSPMRNDNNYKACGGWCKSTRGNNHCRFCKCQDCLFCRAAALLGGGDAAAAAPGASDGGGRAQGKVLVVATRPGAEARLARALGHRVALLGHEVRDIDR